MLNKKVQEVKTKYYDNQDIKGYLKKCEKKIELPIAVSTFIEQHKIEIFKIEHENFPSEEWSFTISFFQKGEFSVKYTTELEISKLTSIYSLLHSFEVENRDPERMGPILFGDSDEPYAFLQADFSKVIEDSLSELGYERLHWSEGQRKIEGVSFADDVVFYGPDVTVSDLVFLDVLDAKQKEIDNLSKNN